jgi:hypothetical protein
VSALGRGLEPIQRGREERKREGREAQARRCRPRALGNEIGRGLWRPLGCKEIGRVPKGG